MVELLFIEMVKSYMYTSACLLNMLWFYSIAFSEMFDHLFLVSEHQGSRVLKLSREKRPVSRGSSKRNYKSRISLHARFEVHAVCRIRRDI